MNVEGGNEEEREEAKYDTSAPHCRLPRPARLGQGERVKLGEHLQSSGGASHYLKVTGRFSPMAERKESSACVCGVRLKIAFSFSFTRPSVLQQACSQL